MLPALNSWCLHQITLIKSQCNFQHTSEWQHIWSWEGLCEMSVGAKKSLLAEKKCAKYTCGSVIELTSRWPSCAILIFILFFSFLLLILQCSSFSYAFFIIRQYSLPFHTRTFIWFVKIRKPLKWFKRMQIPFCKKTKNKNVTFFSVLVLERFVRPFIIYPFLFFSLSATPACYPCSVHVAGWCDLCDLHSCHATCSNPLQPQGMIDQCHSSSDN